ncbi:DUF5719 family protein [Phycicoccus sp. SLBN-51]|uniref:DUF5719 family protein n=1 Tax=Phycicoccus sp. SLBN-51 TaxID=2768447 RepID=UPI0011549526|nr:DUF5719 family protein [Phycicoccus sp. SLBN-51]TQJ51701.1 hypothetical protein FBY26_3439 [Phycicoccus sp. SLBN-51]
MIVSPKGIVRAVLAAGGGAALVYAAVHAPGAVALGPTSNADTSRDGGTRTVRSAALVCPGPELKGLAGIDDLPVDVTVAASAAPVRALTGLSLPSQDGTFSLTDLDGGSARAKTTARGLVSQAQLTKPSAVLLRGEQSMAPGLAAAQSWLVTEGDHRGLGMTSCGSPSADAWLIAGAGAAGRQERLVLTNPGENPVTVDLTLHGAKGIVDSPVGKGIVVPSRGRTVVLLDSIAGTEGSPAVHVVAQGGEVHAVLNDYWLDGSIAAGSDDAVAAAAPSRDQVIPAVALAGSAALRVVVPGHGEGVVQARALTPSGPRALPKDGVVRVAGGSVRDISLNGLPAGTYGLQVRADVPVVAGAVVQRRTAATAVGDFAWTASTPAIRGAAGTPLPSQTIADKPLDRSLALTSSGDTAGVEVVTTDASGKASSRRLTVGADSSATVDLTGATSVWVHRLSGKGQVRAGVVVGGSDAKGALVTVLPLKDAVLRTTNVGLLEVPQ